MSTLLYRKVPAFRTERGKMCRYSATPSPNPPQSST